MTMKGCFTFPKTPELEPHHQLQFSVTSRTLVVGREVLIPLKRCNWHILQHQPTGIYIYISWSFASWSGSTEFIDSFSPSVSRNCLFGCILCRYRADVSLCWSTNSRTSMCRNTQENIADVVVFFFFLWQCTTCLVRLTGMVSQMWAKWP